MLKGRMGRSPCAEQLFVHKGGTTKDEDMILRKRK